MDDEFPKDSDDDAKVAWLQQHGFKQIPGTTFWGKDTVTNQEINEAVAKKLGGERRILPDAVLQDGTVIKHYPDYCGSIQAAWEILQHNPHNPGGGWLVNCSEAKDGHGPYGCAFQVGPYEWHWEYADTAPLAICKAFLKLP